MKKRTIFSLLASITCFVSKPVTAFTVPSLYSRTFHSSSIKLKSSKYDSQYENNKPNNPTFEDFDVTDDITSSSPLGRRAAVSGTVKWARASVLGLFLNGACSEDVRAFPNKISNQYDDRPKRRGPQPKDLGVKTRKDMIGEEYNGLKSCGPAPNCFCSTDDIIDDPDHNIPAWKWPSSFGDNKEMAFLQLEEAVKAYKPGQNNIDGGGFQIVSSNPEKGYLYAQFESLKNGYIDDFEFAWIGVNDDKVNNQLVQVRSSSRVGYLDYGVNAKRINYIAKELREKGWDSKGVESSTHNGYVAENRI